MITLYQVEWCPTCHLVRQLLSELGITYLTVNVPAEKSQRAELRRMSGQDTVPVLTDEERVLRGGEAIVEYLQATYPPAEDMQAHREKSLWRYILESDTPAEDSLARLKQLLPEHGFQIVCETGITPREQDATGTYVLLHVVDPKAVALTLAADPSVPAALTIPLAVYPIADGSQIVLTDPGAGAWLSGQRDLLQVGSKLRERIKKLFEEL